MAVVKYRTAGEYASVGKTAGLYVVRSENGPWLRTGSSKNLQQRLAKHGRAPWGDNWTTKNGSWQLVWAAEFDSPNIDTHLLTALEAGLHGRFAMDFAPVARSGFTQPSFDEDAIGVAIEEFKVLFERTLRRHLGKVVFA